MGKKEENTGFLCQNCGKQVLPIEKGSYRNHCPFCLYSVHVDCQPGDRQSECLGLMKPVSVRKHSKKGYQILHKCVQCGFERYNMITEDSQQPDNMSVILNIMRNSF